jgi:hypothetical protein
MKPNIKQITLFAAASSAFTAAGYAQSAIPGYEQTVTMQMAIHSTAPGTFEKDEDGKTITPKVPAYENSWTKENSDGDTIQENYEEVAKIQTLKVGNKEILEELVDAGVIPSITGWSIKLISTGAYGDSEFYLVKKDVKPIYIGDYLYSWDQAYAEAYNETEVTKYDAEGDVTSFKETGKGNTIQLLKTILDTDGESYEFNLHGLLTTSSKFSETDDEHVSNGGSYKLVGSLDFPSEDGPVQGAVAFEDGPDDYSSVVEGTWKISAAKRIADISVDYPEVEGDWDD